MGEEYRHIPGPARRESDFFPNKFFAQNLPFLLGFYAHFRAPSRTRDRLHDREIDVGCKVEILIA
jgi:hypothetical protein